MRQYLISMIAKALGLTHITVDPSEIVSALITQDETGQWGADITYKDGTTERRPMTMIRP